MNWFKKHKILTVIGVVILLAAIGGAAGGGNKTTNNQTAQPATSTQATTSEPAKAETPKVSIQEFYEKIQNGQTKEEVAAMSGGREAKNCTESETEYIGKIETCSFGDFSDKGIITVTYSDGKVSSKIKNNF